MAMVTPKTIVITTSVSPKSPIPVLTSSTSPSVNMNKVMAESLLADSGRKRRRLTHLTPEERLLRRKLKNRVAAQTARDRKKAKMDDLEEIVQTLEAENRRLETENMALKQKTGALTIENKQLREKLGHPAELTTIKSEPESSESAELVIPPPQELALTLSRWAGAQCAAWVLSLALMTYLSSCNKSQQQPRTKSTSTLQKRRRQVLSVTHSPRWHPWWGPQQQSWNPSMN